jgi:hypothetical protein
VRAGERAERAYAYLTAADRFRAALALMERRGAPPQERGWFLFHLAMTTSYADHAGTIASLDAAARLAEAAGDRTLLAYATCRRGWIRCNAGDPGRGIAELAAGIAALDALPATERVTRIAPGDAVYWRDDRASLVLYLAQVGGTATRVPTLTD